MRMNILRYLYRKLRQSGLVGEYARLDNELSELSSALEALRNRVDEAENKLVGYYRNRWDAIDNLADYLVGAAIEGDYYEFGVYQGKTFAFACQKMSPVFPNMRYIAFDSFQGLPGPKGIDLVEGYSSTFYEGQFSCSETEFISYLQKRGVDLERVVTVGGWFSQTLKEETAERFGLGKIAAAWIDCDLYESTVPVLKFITPRLSVGSVLLFDDWRCFRNLPDFGQQRACSEWLSENPQMELRHLLSFGWHGSAFTVAGC